MSRVTQILSSDDSKFAAVIAAYQARTAAGELVDHDDVITQHPELADRLRLYFETKGFAATVVSGPAESTNDERAETPTVNRIVSDTSHSPAVHHLKVQIPEVFGRYKILRALGQGAMGTVYLAHDTQLDRQVALKVPKFTEAEETELLERFYREARAAAMLRHPRICPVYDVGAIEGRHYISMAFIEGHPLKDFTQSPTRPTERQTAVTIRKLALAMAEAHAHGIVHRDLKPANIIVDKKGEPIVMDFGLARRLSCEEGLTTQSGMIIGTPAYMSPEQAQGDPKAVGPQADVYGLGIIFYELLTGQVPFQGTLMSILRQALLDDPRPPSQLRLGIDPRLEGICLKMLAKDRRARYASMNDVARDLGDWLRGRATTGNSTLTSSEHVANRSRASLARTIDETVAVSRVDSRILPRPTTIALTISGGLILVATGLALYLTGETAAVTDPPARMAPSVAEPAPPQKEVDASLATVAPVDALPADIENVQNYALRFPTVESQAVLPRIAFDRSGPLTIELWARGFSGRAQEQLFLVMFGPIHLKLFHEGAAPVWSAVVVDSKGKPRPIRASLNWPWPAVQSEPVDTHLAFVRSGSTLQLFVNGRSVAKRSNFSQGLPSEDRYSLGMGGNWDGWIDEVRISRTARYSTEFKPSQRFEPDADTLALYHCDAGRDTRLTDDSGYGHHGELSDAMWVRLDGTLVRRTGTPRDAPPAPHREPLQVVHYGLTFDGIDDYVVIPSLSLDVSESVTIEGFTTCENADGFVQLATLYGPETAFRVAIYHSTLNTGVHLGEGGAFHSSPTRIRPDRRFHFAATWDGTQSRVYFNGVEGRNGYEDRRNAAIASQSGLVLGAVGERRGDQVVPPDYGFLKGRVDGLRISKGVRYGGDFVPPLQLDSDESTRALYRFDEGQGDECRDASGHGHEGHIYGGAAWFSTNAVK